VLVAPKEKLLTSSSGSISMDDDKWYGHF
jgi:hypothetical protein